MLPASTAPIRAEREAAVEDMAPLPRARARMTPQALHESILQAQCREHSGLPDTGHACTDLRIFEVLCGKPDSSDTRHLPGACHFDTLWIEGPPLWNLHAANVIERNLLAAGITADTTVVLYGVDPLPVLRVFWALTWAGVKDVRYLDGGLSAWLRQGLPVQPVLSDTVPADIFGTSIPVNPQINLSMPADVLKAQRACGLKLISNRSRAEFDGITSGYDYIPARGEPEGAIWGLAGTDASNMADYFCADGTLRNPQDIFAQWEKQGIRRGDHLAFYCGTGWRASVAWFITWLAGWENTCVYDGGWLAWQMDSVFPVQNGAPEGMSKPDARNNYGAVMKEGASCKS